MKPTPLHTRGVLIHRRDSYLGNEIADALCTWTLNNQKSAPLRLTLSTQSLATRLLAFNKSTFNFGCIVDGFWFDKTIRDVCMPMKQGKIYTGTIKSRLFCDLLRDEHLATIRAAEEPADHVVSRAMEEAGLPLQSMSIN